MTCALVALWQVGAHIDAWYHVHHGFEVESFFTWPHALLYGSWAGTGAVITLCLVGRARRGFPRRAWLPGYPLVLVGVVLFGLGGIVDSVWHSLFGFEVRLEALLSPAHLWLVVAYTLVVLGVLRAEAQHRTQTGRHGYRPSPADIPLLLGFGLLFRVILWGLFYSDPLAVDYASGESRLRSYGATRVWVGRPELLKSLA